MLDGSFQEEVPRDFKERASQLPSKLCAVQELLEFVLARLSNQQVHLFLLGSEFSPVPMLCSVRAGVGVQLKDQRAESAFDGAPITRSRLQSQYQVRIHPSSAGYADPHPRRGKEARCLCPVHPGMV